MRAGLAVAVLSGCIGLCLWTCSGSIQEVSEPTEASGELSPAVETAPPDTAISTDDADFDERNGGVLLVDNICSIADPAIDVAISDRSVPSLPMVSEIHAGLTRISKDVNAEVDLDLASSFAVREDGKIYDFTLRHGLQFSDGSPLTAADVKWSWERALRKSTDSSRASDVLGWIEGADAVLSGDSDELSGIEVIDDQRLLVKLKGTRHDFLMLLADPIASVLKRENVESWGYEWENVVGEDLLDKMLEVDSVPRDAFTGSGVPVGAGPFRLVEYSPFFLDRGCTLERNDHYWGRHAYLDGVKFVDGLHAGDGSDAEYIDRVLMQAFDEHRIDYTFVVPEVADRTGDGPGSLRGKLIRQPSTPYSQFLILNPAHAPFDDVHFRRALTAASDLDAMFEPFPVRWQRRIVPPETSSGSADISGLPFSLTNAIDELNLSIYADGSDDFEAVYYARSYGELDDRFGRLLSSWRDNLGFDVSHDHGSSRFIADLAASGELHMSEIEVFQLYPDPHATLRAFLSVFGKENISPEMAELEEMITDAMSETDDAARQMRHDEIERHILEEALAIPLLLSWDGYEVLLQPWVHDFEIPMFPGSAFHDVWLDDSAPERTLR